MNTQDNKLIVICSAAGGTGKTTLTVNLASAIAKEGRHVTIVDGDLQFGDATIALDLNPAYTIKEAAERNDSENIHFYLSEHSAGIRLLSAPSRPEHADFIPSAKFQSIIDALRTQSDIVLVDTATGLTDQNIELMEKADAILIAASPGMHVLKNTKRMIETLSALDMKEKLNLTINKFTAPSAVPSNKIQELTGMEDAYFLPDDPKRVNESLDLGKPLVHTNSKLDFSKAVTAIRDSLLGSNQTEEKKSVFSQALKKLNVKHVRGER